MIPTFMGMAEHFLLYCYLGDVRIGATFTRRWHYIAICDIEDNNLLF